MPEASTCIAELSFDKSEGVVYVCSMGEHETASQTLRDAILRAEERGITRARLSALTGISQGVLSRFVHGERDLRLETADKLCDVLGLQLTPRKEKKKGR